MSDPISASSYGTLDRTLAAIKSLDSQVSTLQEQTSTGEVSQSYAGLADVSSQVLDLTAAKSRSTAYDQVISDAQGKAGVMQTVLGQIGSLVSSVSTAALGLNASTPSSTVSSVADQAKAAFTQVASLLNTQYEGQYVFAGADGGNPPVPNAADATSSGFFTQIGAAVSALATVPSSPSVDTVISNTVATASSTDPATSLFSAYLLSSGATATPAQVQVSDTQAVSLGMTANANLPGVVSDPSIAGTGSAMSDILRGLAVLANSTTAIASNPDFATLVQNATDTLSSANGTLTQETGVIGQTQDTLTAAASANSSFQLAMTTQLNGLTNVDLASTISQLQTVNTQLQASYKLVSMASDLSLANYLSVGT